jgi:hypothetical protein
MLFYLISQKDRVKKTQSKEHIKKNLAKKP